MQEKDISCLTLDSYGVDTYILGRHQSILATDREREALKRSFSSAVYLCLY